MNFSKINELKPYDLNCNIFDVYSYDGLSMQELLCQFFTKINECIKTSNETIDLAEWLVNEGLKQEVAIKLTNWLNDGTLEELINVTLFENLNKKIDNVSSQLEHIENKKINGFINIDDLGAISNYNNLSKTGFDNTNIINNAINKAYEEGKYVYIPRKSYFINGTINFKSSTKIVSDGGYLYYGGNDICIKISGDINNHSFPHLEGLNIEKVGRDRIGTGVIIEFSRMGGKFIDLDIVGFKVGVKHSVNSVLSPTPNPQPKWSWLNFFERCKIRHNQTGLILDTNSNGVTINNCLINNNDWYGISCVDTTNVRITNCEFEENGKESQTNAISLSGACNTIINGCYFEYNGHLDLVSPVIFISGTRKSIQTIITNNFFNTSNCKKVIHLGNCQTFNISGNTFYKNSDLEYDIYISNSASTVNSVVMGNTVGSKLEFESDLKYGANNSYISHGQSGFLKNEFEIKGNNSKLILDDSINNKQIKIENLNGKCKVSDNNGSDVLIVDTVAKQVTLSIKSYSNKNSLPLTGNLNITMAYLLDCNKVVFCRDNVWRYSDGSIV